MSDISPFLLWGVLAAPACASFGMLAGDRWTPNAPLSKYLADIAARPTACDGCAKPIAAPTLIPIFGWLFARGRCQCRKMRLSPAYLIGEILALIFFLACAHAYGARALYTLPAIAGAAAALRSDLKCREVHELSYLLIAAGAVPYAATSFDWGTKLELAGAFAIAFLITNVYFLLRKRLPVIPYADLIIAAALLLFLNINSAILFMGVLALSVIAIAIALKLTDHETNVDDPMTFIPMAPALILAAAIAIPFACYL